MQTTYSLDLQSWEGTETKVLHFSLDALLPSDQKLALNIETRTMALLTEGPQLIVEHQFSVNEWHMILPILSFFPHYCPYEVLLSYLSVKTVTSATIEQCRERLQEAQKNGAWQQELRPIRRAISSLRPKLYSFQLGISNVRERGCGLTGMSRMHHLHLL